MACVQGFIQRFAVFYPRGWQSLLTQTEPTTARMIASSAPLAKSITVRPQHFITFARPVFG